MSELETTYVITGKICNYISLNSWHVSVNHVKNTLKIQDQKKKGLRTVLLKYFSLFGPIMKVRQIHSKKDTDKKTNWNRCWFLYLEKIAVNIVLSMFPVFYLCTDTCGQLIIILVPKWPEVCVNGAIDLANTRQD